MKAMILGGAECVWRDVDALEKLVGEQWPGIVVATNEAGTRWPRRLDHWCTLHPNLMPPWIETRRVNGYPDGHTTWRGERHPDMTDRKVSEGWHSGSSGMLAIGVAHDLGCTHAVLCGVPLDKRSHFEGATTPNAKVPWYAATHYQATWGRHQQKMQGWVKSMSGWTRELLGEPTHKWLANLPERYG